MKTQVSIDIDAGELAGLLASGTAIDLSEFLVALGAQVKHGQLTEQLEELARFNHNEDEQGLIRTAITALAEASKVDA